MDHLPYSSDLAPSDFHKFDPMKEALLRIRIRSLWRGAKFVKDAIKKLLF
jgi:hypothetical protein